jgi:hypothetical protein
MGKNLADGRRDPHETKELLVKGMVDMYRRNKQGECPSSQVREFEKLATEKLLPGTYDKKK